MRKEGEIPNLAQEVDATHFSLLRSLEGQESSGIAGLGFRFQGSGLRASGLQGLRFRASGLGFGFRAVWPCGSQRSEGATQVPQ